MESLESEFSHKYEEFFPENLFGHRVFS